MLILMQAIAIVSSAQTDIFEWQKNTVIAKANFIEVEPGETLPGLPSYTYKSFNIT